MSSSRLGVDVEQVLTASAAAAVTPTLVPVVLGVCNQIVEALDSEGAVNADAKYPDSQYNQTSMLITQGNFPDPRDNIDELNIDEATVKAYLKFGGRLKNLPRGSNGTYGQAFLKGQNTAKRAAFLMTSAGDFAFGATAVVFTFCLDVPNETDTSQDITVSLSGTMTVDEVVSAVNTAAGADVASASGSKLLLTSTLYGAGSSVTVRAGGGALLVLCASGSYDTNVEYKVTGSGFVGQDDQDNDLTTPWVTYFRGEYTEDGVENTTWDAWALLADADGATQNTRDAALTFTGSGADIPMKAATATKPGDQFWADGVMLGSAQIIKVESTRFKLGTLNNVRSTFDDDGEPTNRVYDTYEVNTLSHSNPLAPKYVYFRADGLEFGDISPVGAAATKTGSNVGRSERAAIVQSTEDITFPVSTSGLTFIYTTTVDGVQGEEQTITFPGAAASANIAALVAVFESALDDDDLIIGNAGDRLSITTAKTGADQGISVAAAGTLNPSVEFSAADATEDTGKDVEFCTLASVTGAGFSLPIGTALNALEFSLTVVDSKGTHAVSGSLAGNPATGAALVAALSTALGGDGVSTIKNGDIQVGTLSATDVGGVVTLTVSTLEGGDSVSLSLDATDETTGFRFLGFYDNAGDQPAEVEGLGVAFPLAALGTQVLTVTVNDGSGPVILSDAMTAASEEAAADAEALALLLNANAALTDGGGVRLVQYYVTDAGGIGVRSVAGGAAASVVVTNAAAGTVILNGAPNGGSGAASAGNTDDEGEDGIKGTALGFYLDANPTLLYLTFGSNSLQDAIDGINELVAGAGDVASDSSGALKLTSLYAGVASSVEIYTTAPYDTAASLFGLSGSAAGSGRPDPDFYLDVDGAANVAANILRNTATGVPFSLAAGRANLYIQYTALRLDVTPSAETPALLSFDTTSDMEEAIGPISTKNPLALGTFFAMLNAPGTSVSAMGIDEKNDAAPFGTLDGWSRTLDLLEQKEVYAVAPITDDTYIQGLVASHVQAMSEPAARMERICFIAPPFPSRALPTTILSGEDGETNGTTNSFTLDDSPSAELAAAGITGPAIDYDEQLYLELLVTDGGATELRRYSVSNVNNTVLTLRASFADDENVDGFYTTTPLSEELSGTDWTLYVRGDALVVAGTDRADLSAIASTAADEGKAYAHRRVYALFGRSVDTTIDGVTQNIPMCYVSAGIAGMVAQLAPQQPLSLVPMVGFGKVYGTDDTFNEDKLDVISDGGRYILVNQGSGIASRHSRSTDVTSIIKQELSITKALDWLAKGLRQTCRVYIGKYVITPGFLDQLSISTEGFLTYAEGKGAVSSADLSDIAQSSDEPDTILLEVEVQPAYPCNKIKITIIT